jgi:hypothetical protein
MLFPYMYDTTYDKQPNQNTPHPALCQKKSIFFSEKSRLYMACSKKTPFPEQILLLTRQACLASDYLEQSCGAA